VCRRKDKYNAAILIESETWDMEEVFCVPSKK